MLETNPGKRIWLSVSLALVAVSLLVWSAPDYQYRPHGIVLPIAESKPAISPNQVVFYPQPPPDYEKIGMLRIVVHYSPNIKNFQQLIVNYAKTLASRVGANGVLIKGWGVSPANTPSSQSIYQLEGWAIYIPNRPFQNHFKDRVK